MINSLGGPAPVGAAFQAFEEEDWDLYGSVRSDAPLISHAPWGDVILAGTWVYAMFDDEKATEFSRDFGLAAVARLVAERLAAFPDAPHDLVEQYLDRWMPRRP